MNKFSRNLLLFLAFSLLLNLTFLLANVYAGETFSSFIKGGTMSHVPDKEDDGFVFKNYNGVVESPYVTMKNRGCNYAHFDVFTGSGNRSIDMVKIQAKRAKDAGLKVLINFFYSDGYQNTVPPSWPTDINLLKTQIYNYTTSCLQTLSDYGAAADIVKIGNEIDGTYRDGFLIPIGQKSTNYANFIDLLKQGINATKAFDSTIPVCIHSADNSPTDNVNFYQGLINNGVNFDVIALSVYGESNFSFAKLQSNLTTLANTFNKKILVVETAYRWTDQEFDASTNRYDTTESGYAHTFSGQYSYLSNMMDMVAKTAGNKGVGVLVWPMANVATTNSASSSDSSCFWNSSTGKAIDSIYVWGNVVEIGTGMSPMTVPSTTVLLDDNMNNMATGSAPTGWLLNTPTGSNISVVEKPSATNKSMDLHYNSTSGTCVAKKTFAETSSNLACEFRINSSDLTNAISKIKLMKDDSELVYLAVKNGSLYNRVNNSTECIITAISPNTWYNVKVVVRPEKYLYYFDIYVNGVLKQVRCGGYSGQSSVNKVHFENWSSGEAHFYVGSVKVTK